MDEIWLARDKNNNLFLYIGSEPTKDCTFNEWNIQELSSLRTRVIELNIDSFPEVKWSDEKPTKVKLVIDK